jgi:hypothetical protein
VKLELQAPLVPPVLWVLSVPPAQQAPPVLLVRRALLVPLVLLVLPVLSGQRVRLAQLAQLAQLVRLVLRVFRAFQVK